MAELSIRREGAILVITLNRPEVRNALSRSLRTELTSALDTAAEQDDVRAVVLTGAGTAFCAGLDLRELEESLSFDSAEHRTDSKALAELFLQLVRFPKPLIAAVNGSAVAGGAGLVTACDVAVMAQGARLGYTEARIGFVAALVAVLLVRQVGDKHARDLLLSARLIEAGEALALGLVNEVTAPEAVLSRALEIASAMTRNAPGSLMLTKSLLADLPGMSLDAGMAWAVDVNALARSGAELGEGVRSFLEKREPSWRA